MLYSSSSSSLRYYPRQTNIESTNLSSSFWQLLERSSGEDLIVQKIQRKLQEEDVLNLCFLNLLLFGIVFMISSALRRREHVVPRWARHIPVLMIRSIIAFYNALLTVEVLGVPEDVKLEYILMLALLTVEQRDF